MKGESVHKMCTSAPSLTPLGVEATDGGSMPPPTGTMSVLDRAFKGEL